MEKQSRVVTETGSINGVPVEVQSRKTFGRIKNLGSPPTPWQEMSKGELLSVYPAINGVHLLEINGRTLSVKIIDNQVMEVSGTE